MSRDLPPGVGVGDIPGNRAEDVAWEKAHELLDRAAEHPEEAILLVKWTPRLEKAARAVERAFTGDKDQSTLDRMRAQAQALGALADVLGMMFADRIRYEEEARPVGVPPRGWYDHEDILARTMECASCGANIAPPGIDGKCVDCAADGPTTRRWIGTSGQAAPPADCSERKIPPLDLPGRLRAEARALDEAGVGADIADDLDALAERARGRNLTAACRRCEDCEDEEHHWLTAQPGYASAEPEHPAAKAGLDVWEVCKHCSAWRDIPDEDCDEEPS